MDKLTKKQNKNIKKKMYSFLVGDIIIRISYNILKTLNLIIEETELQENIFVEENINFYKTYEINQKNIRPVFAEDDKDVFVVEIKKENLIPEFKNFKDLKDYLFEILNIIGNLESKKSKTVLMFSKSNIRRGLKRAREKNSIQFFADLKSVVENSLCAFFEKSDKDHPNVLGQDIYYTVIKIGEQYFAIEIKADVQLRQKNNKYFYAGHKVREICIDKIKHQGIDTENKSVYNPDKISIAQLRKIFK